MASFASAAALGSVSLANPGLGLFPDSALVKPALRRRFRVTLCPKLKPETLRRKICRAATSIEKAADPVPRRLEAGSAALADADVAGPARRFLRAGSRNKGRNGSTGSRVVLGGAAATAAAAGIQIGSHLVSAVESVPALANLELLMGIAVSAKSVVSYFTDSKARGKVDGKLASILDTLSQSLALVGSPPASAGARASSASSASSASPPALPASAAALASAPALDAPPLPSVRPPVEPTMLEVEVRSIVDNAKAASRDTSAAAVTVDRPRLVGSFVDFIRSRERQSLDILEELEADGKEPLDASEAVRRSLAELEKSKAGRRSGRLADASAVAKMQELQDLQRKIEEERREGQQRVSELQADLTSLSLSAKHFSATNNKRPRLPTFAEFFGISSAKTQAVSEADPGMEAKAQAVQEKLQSLQALYQTRSEPDRAPLMDSAMERELVSLREKMSQLEGQLKGVSESRSTLLTANAELQLRVQEATAQNRALKSQLSELKGVLANARSAVAVAEETGRSLGASRLAFRGRPATADGASAPRACAPGAWASLEAELGAANEGLQKYTGATKWLRQQLSEIESAQDAEKAEQLRSSLEFAEMRAQEEEMRIAEVRAKMAAMDKAASEEQTALANRVADLESRLSKGLLSRQVAGASTAGPVVLSPLLRGAGPEAEPQSESESEDAIVLLLPTLVKPTLVNVESLSAGGAPSRSPLASPSRGSPLLCSRPSPGSPAAPSRGPLTCSSTSPLLAVAEASATAVAVPALELSSTGNAAATAATWLREISARVKDGAEGAKGQGQRWRAPLIAPMTESQLRTYAKAIYRAYVPKDGDSAEQESGKEALIKDLQRKGAEEPWARALVLKDLASHYSEVKKSRSE